LGKLEAKFGQKYLLRLEYSMNVELSSCLWKVGRVPARVLMR